MTIYLEKLLPVFVLPVGLAIVLCLSAFGLLIARRGRAARVLMAIVILGLWVASMPAFADLITAPLEDQYPAISIRAAPAVDVIVVLGGGIAAPRVGLTEVGLGKAADRLGQAYALWRAGKGRVILISGGNLPWSEWEKPEAEMVAAVLQEIGVPRDSILLEGASENTRQNALNTALLWHKAGFRSGFLVTSAAHMPRALATFRKAGLELMPWPAAFQVSRSPAVRSVFDFLPNADTLAITTSSAKEWLALVVYRWRGWI